MGSQYDAADMFETTVRKIDEPVRRKIGFSVFHALSLASIGASIALFVAGRKDLAIFVGLWPPTFEALRAAAENRRTTEMDYR
jgi:hypothetical protein